MHVTNVYGEMRYTTSALDRSVSFSFKLQPLYPRGKISRQLLNRRLGRHWIPSGSFGNEKTIFSLHASQKAQFFDSPPVTLLLRRLWHPGHSYGSNVQNDAIL